MSLLEKQEKFLEFQNELFNKCWEDENYKKELMANPIEVLARDFEVGFIQGTKVQVIDQTDSNTMSINIPPRPNFENVELSEADLEYVAGGAAASWTFNIGNISFGTCVNVPIGGGK